MSGTSGVEWELMRHSFALLAFFFVVGLWIIFNHIMVQWLMKRKETKSPFLGHSSENSLSKAVFPEELNGLVPQS